jgi:hypothetical protein
MLPPRLKEAFGLSDVDRSQSERQRAWLRRIYPALPLLVGSARAGPAFRGLKSAQICCQISRGFDTEFRPCSKRISGRSSGCPASKMCMFSPLAI